MNRQLPYLITKRAFDIGASVVMAGITAPLMLVISVAVSIESAGSPIYVHERVGRDGTRIKVLKFRSMRSGRGGGSEELTDDELEAYCREYKLERDPRVTRVGRWLRRSSLDELPQLFNVIAGSMSLVGPRPVTADELKFYTDSERTLLLSVKPGITGYWQVNGRNEVTYESGRRQEYELHYAKNASLILDAAILLRTPLAVIRRRGAF